MIYAGQVWMHKSKRRGTRYVRVEFVCHGGARVRIQRCDKHGRKPKGARSTEVDADRFTRFGSPDGFILTNVL